MPHAFLLQDLAVVMAVAAATTALFRFLRLPVVLGYLVAGVLIGPHTPPFAFIQDLTSIHTMAELGLVFLMFALGLEFSLPKLARVGLPAVGAGVLEIAAMFAAGVAVAAMFGWSRGDGVFMGAMLSISSTTIIVKVLLDLKRERERFAQLVFGLLIVEDVAAVGMLSLLPIIGHGLGGSGAAAGAFGILLRIAFFAVFFLVLGLSLVPRLLGWVGKFRSREAVGITSLGVCLLGAVAASKAGFSVALGAFLAGAVIAASSEAERVEVWFHPVRDMFSALFFVSAGMLIAPGALWEHRWIVLVSAVVVVVGKTLAVGAGILLVGMDVRTALRTGVSMGQIGEFSFVIAGLGVTTGLGGDFLFPVAVGISSVTTLVAPLLIRHSDALAEFVEGRAPARLLAPINRYHAWTNAQFRASSRAETVILSRYLVRLTLYSVLFAALALVATVAARALTVWGKGSVWVDVSQAALWMGGLTLSFPVTTALAKYADHQALLMFTLFSPTWLLVRVNIRRFYAVCNGMVMTALYAFLGWTAAPFFNDGKVLIGAGVLVVLAAYVFRRATAYGRERLEALFDEIVGLATSEPTRQAVMRSGASGHEFRDLTEEALIPKSGAVVGKTLSQLRLREISGASVVALYRHGRHIANPGPDACLESGDVAILLGDPEQRRRATTVLMAPANGV